MLGRSLQSTPSKCALSQRPSRNLGSAAPSPGGHPGLHHAHNHHHGLTSCRASMLSLVGASARLDEGLEEECEPASPFLGRAAPAGSRHAAVAAA